MSEILKSMDDWKRLQAKVKREQWEKAFLLQVRAADLPAPVEQLRFHPTRRWRLDFAWPDEKLAVEIDGGVFSGGRHTRGTGYTEDCSKLNEAAVLGWSVLRFTTGMVRQRMALTAVERWFRSRGRI